jgi:hypothetical protein
MYFSIFEKPHNFSLPCIFLRTLYNLNLHWKRNSSVPFYVPSILLYWTLYIPRYFTTDPVNFCKEVTCNKCNMTCGVEHSTLYYCTTKPSCNMIKQAVLSIKLQYCMHIKLHLKQTCLSYILLRVSIQLFLCCYGYELRAPVALFEIINFMIKMKTLSRKRIIMFFTFCAIIWLDNILHDI